MLKPGSSQWLSHPSVGHMAYLLLLWNCGLMASEYTPSYQVVLCPYLCKRKALVSWGCFDRWPAPWSEFWSGRENSKVLTLGTSLGAITQPVQGEKERRIKLGCCYSECLTLSSPPRIAFIFIGKFTENKIHRMWLLFFCGKRQCPDQSPHSNMI